MNITVTLPPDLEKALTAAADRSGVTPSEYVQKWIVSNFPPLERPAQKRPFGLCAGKFKVPADFDAPLPDDVLDLFDGK